MTTARALRGPFDYRLPDELREAGVQVGSMLVVPFGRRNVLGVVVGLAGGLPASGAPGARAGARRDRAGPRDRAHAADRRTLHRPLRRDRRGAPLAAAPRGALLGVAPPAPGRGARLRRAALGRLRAHRRRRPDRGG